MKHSFNLTFNLLFVGVSGSSSSISVLCTKYNVLDDVADDDCNKVL